MTTAESFQDPAWDEPLDVDGLIAAIPADATISGMFSHPITVAARRSGVTLKGARERYVPFQFYSQREHVALMLEACAVLYPDRSTRRALRSLGRGAPEALAASTLGKIVFASAQGAHEVLAALAKTYSLNLRPGRAVLIDSSVKHTVFRLTDIHFFLDCHHVGVFEGALRYARAKGSVLYKALGPTSAEFFIEWEE